MLVNLWHKMDVEVLKSLNSPKASLKMDSKKSKKPLMEKMRRARINESLNELKELVLDALKKDASRYSKMEKADILEMTVKYLKTLQRKQSQPKDVLSLARYRSGFNECASEVTRYLMTADNVSERLQTQLLSHLASYYQTQAEPSLKHEAAHPQNPIASPVSTFPAIAPMYAPTTSHFGAFPSPPSSPFKKARDSTVMGSPVVLSNGVPAILVPHDARVHIMPLTWQNSAESALWRPW